MNNLTMSGKQKELVEDKSTITLVGGAAGSGATHALFLKALSVANSPNARIIFIVSSPAQVKQSGGLLEVSQTIFSDTGATYNKQNMSWEFPSGALLEFVVYNKGEDFYTQAICMKDCSLLLIEDAKNYSVHDILCLHTRVRPKEGSGGSGLVMTSNPCTPDNRSFLYDWVKPLIDSDFGLPVRSDSPLTRKFSLACNGIRFHEGGDYVFKFVPMTVYDNKWLLESCPDYLSRLLSLDVKQRKRFLLGSWLA